LAALIVRPDVLIRTWRDTPADLRQDSTARKAVDILAKHPVVSSDLIAARLEVSERSGRIALRTLADRGSSSRTRSSQRIPGGQASSGWPVS
jgi:hypothetical protein